MPEASWGGRPFAEQLDFFRRKVSVPTRAWTDLWHEAHDTGFMVAGAYKADLLQDLRNAVERAIAEGTTLETFRREFRAIVSRHGWSYKGGEGWRTRTIFETNLRSSYAAGRYRQLTDPDLLLHRPWWRYSHSDAVEHPRQEHVGWDGLVLRADDPWWRTHYPPNGWGCQCWVESLGPEDMARLGKTGPDRAPEIVTETRTVGIRGPSPRTVDVPIGIDPGWAYAPGASRISDRAREVLEKRLPALEAQLRKALQQQLQVPFKNPTVDEAIEAGRELLDELGAPAAAKLSIDGAAELRRAIRERLAEARSLSTPASTVTRRGRGVDLLREASTRFPDDWTEFAGGCGPLHVRAWTERGYHVSIPQGMPPIEATLEPFGKVIARPGDGYLCVDSLNAAVHEYAHRLQFAMPGLDDYFQGLHRRRTAGDGLERLQDLAPQWDYEPDEWTRRDKYADPYFGKEYPPAPHGGPSGALEVLTMTFEALLGEDRNLWVDLWRGDPELVELAVGLLLRYRPGND